MELPLDSSQDLFSCPLCSKCKIAGLPCLHADVCKMSSLQVHRRRSYSEGNACAALTHTHTHCSTHSCVFVGIEELTKKQRLGIQDSQKKMTNLPKCALRFKKGLLLSPAKFFSSSQLGFVSRVCASKWEQDKVSKRAPN